MTDSAAQWPDCSCNFFAACHALFMLWYLDFILDVNCRKDNLFNPTRPPLGRTADEFSIFPLGHLADSCL
jgi:hypothetical protein